MWYGGGFDTGDARKIGYSVWLDSCGDHACKLHSLTADNFENVFLAKGTTVSATCSRFEVYPSIVVQEVLRQRRLTPDVSNLAAATRTSALLIPALRQARTISFDSTLALRARTLCDVLTILGDSVPTCGAAVFAQVRKSGVTCDFRLQTPETS
jgi:uncharacterized protein